MKFKHRLLSFFYGAEILNAAYLDCMLRRAINGLHYKRDNPPSEKQKAYYKKLMYLKGQGLIDFSMTESQTFHITEDGKFLLAKGGFTGECKKSKHDIRAFSISCIALFISILAVLFQFFL